MVSLTIMRRWARAIVAAGLLLGSALGAGTVAAEEPRTDAAGEVARPAAPPSAPMSLELTETSRERSIPWDRLDGTAYDLVRDVVDGAALARQVRDISFRSRKPVFDYLLDNPDFAADVARALREGKYRIRRVGELAGGTYGASEKTDVTLRGVADRGGGAGCRRNGSKHTSVAPATAAASPSSMR